MKQYWFYSCEKMQLTMSFTSYICSKIKFGLKCLPGTKTLWLASVKVKHQRIFYNLVERLFFNEGLIARLHWFPLDLLKKENLE
jgi:hypothetical protein